MCLNLIRNIIIIFVIKTRFVALAIQGKTKNSKNRKILKKVNYDMDMSKSNKKYNYHKDYIKRP